MRILIILFLFPSLLQAQDTIRVMQYNILFYGLNDNGCSNSTAAMAAQDAAFKKIIKSTNPDILAINEMANNVVYAQRILQNVLNTDGVSSYRRGEYTNTAGSQIVNMLFYNSDILAIHSEEVINGNIRDINLTRLFYKDPQLGSGADTVFLTVINGHLKAGSSTSDQALRDQMTSNIISNLSAKGVRDNYLALGDFNSRSSSEAGIQNLLNPSDPKVKFLDPINSLGSWNNNSAFANIHTQSTKTSASCGAGGGMDDRFDVIFASEYIMGDSADIQYIPGSYTAYGQDGNRFNSAINTGTNTAVPDSIADALFELSDHLPVYLDLRFNVNTTTSLTDNINSEEIQLLSNPVSNSIDLVLNNEKSFKIIISDLQGRTLHKANSNKQSSLNIPFKMEPGVYILRWFEASGKSGNFRIVKR